MTQADEIQALIDRLVSIHGEEGVCPSASDWSAIFALKGKGPISILNLLAFNAQVETPDGPISGAAAYGKYSSRIAGAFARVGGERIFFGRVGHMFAFGAGERWDAAVLTRYPSTEALAQMWLDAEFIAAHDSRVGGVARSQVFVFGE